MSKAEEYRLRAEEAEEAAERAKGHAAKQAYLDIARQWREMAAWAERNK